MLLLLRIVRKGRLYCRLKLFSVFYCKLLYTAFKIVWWLRNMVDTRSKARDEPIGESAERVGQDGPEAQVGVINPVDTGVDTTATIGVGSKDVNMSVADLQKKVEELFELFSMKADPRKLFCTRNNHAALACPADNDAELDVEEGEEGFAGMGKAFDAYPSHLAFKVYQMGLKETRCKKSRRCHILRGEAGLGSTCPRLPHQGDYQEAYAAACF